MSCLGYILVAALAFGVKGDVTKDDANFASCMIYAQCADQVMAADPHACEMTTIAPKEDI